MSMKMKHALMITFVLLGLVIAEAIPAMMIRADEARPITPPTPSDAASTMTEGFVVQAISGNTELSKS